MALCTAFPDAPRRLQRDSRCQKIPRGLEYHHPHSPSVGISFPMEVSRTHEPAGAASSVKPFSRHRVPHAAQATYFGRYFCCGTAEDRSHAPFPWLFCATADLGQTGSRRHEEAVTLPLRHQNRHLQVKKACRKKLNVFIILFNQKPASKKDPTHICPVTKGHSLHLLISLWRWLMKGLRSWKKSCSDVLAISTASI